jgi:protein SCO1
MKNILMITGLLIWMAACEQKKELPILGASGHTVPAFELTDQDSNQVANGTFKGKIYVADFFFTSCPTICPKMQVQMQRIYEKFRDNPDVLLLSHSIDPKHDTPSVLKIYAENLGAESRKWHFVTGNKENIFEIGQKGYMVTAKDDETAPGGILHSGALVLVDRQQRIRGFYDGTQPNEVTNLLYDIEALLKETNPTNLSSKPN